MDDVISGDETSTFRRDGTMRNIMENVISVKGKTEFFRLAVRHVRWEWVVWGLG